MKKIIIVGNGVSGKRLSKYLISKNIETQIFDDKFPTNLNWNVDGIYFSPGISIFPKMHHLLIKAVENRIPIVNDIDLLYSFNMNAKYIGITGTCGKTTLCEMIHFFLNYSNLPHCYTGNGDNQDFFDSELYLLELSSFQLRTIQWLNLDFGIITNIYPTHLTVHQCLEEYISEKLKVLRMNENKKQFFYLGPGCPEININQSPLKKIDIPKLKADFHKANNKINLSICLTILEQLGIHIDDPDIINKFEFPHYRQETIYKSKNLEIINDSKATNLLALQSAFSNYANFIWIGGGNITTNSKYFVDLLPYLPKIRKAFFFGKSSQDLYAYFKDKITCEILDLETAIAKSIKLEGTILFSPGGDSFDAYSSYKQRGEMFNHTVKKYLAI